MSATVAAVCVSLNSSRWVRLVPWVACLAGYLSQFRPMVFSGFREMHGGLGDARLVNFTMEHGYRWLRQVAPHEDFWRAPIYYPYPTASAFTDTMLGFGPMYWIPRLLGAAPDTAAQWWLAIVYGLNFFAAYMLLRKGVRLGVLEASAGALLMAVISVAWSSHIQLFPFFYVFIGLLALFRIFDTSDAAPGTSARKVWIGVLFGCGLLQAWGAVYPFFFFSLTGAMALIAALILPETRRALVAGIARDRATWVICLALFAILIAPLVYRYGITAEEVGYRNYPRENAARFYSWFIAWPKVPILGWLHRHDILPELPKSQGIGIVTFVVAAIGLWLYRHHPSVKLVAFATVAMMLVSTTFAGFSLWQFVHEYIPGAGGIRAQARVTMILIPAAVIGVALACHWALARHRWWLAAVLVFACVFERFNTIGTIDKNIVRDHVASVVKKVDDSYDAFILVAVSNQGAYINEDAEWATLATGVPTMNGRYGSFPSGYTLRKAVNQFEAEDQAARQKFELALRGWLELWGVDRDRIQVIEYEPTSRTQIRQLIRQRNLATE